MTPSKKDFTKHIDNILVISGQSNNEIVQLLNTMEEYTCKQAKDIDEASKLAEDNIFDLVILYQTRQNDNYKTAINIIKSKLNLSRYNLVVVNPNITDKENSETYKSSNITLIKYPIGKIDFLCKISTKLRLKKLKTKEQEVTNDIIQQNSQLKDVNNKLKAELLEAKNIQNAILPKTLPKVENYSLAVTFIPLDIIGGDIYDIWMIDEEHLGLFLGDVTGHGLSAALIGAMAKMALKYANSPNPSYVLEHINKNMVSVIPEGRFVASSMACLNIKTNQLTISCGGQPAPIIWRKNQNTIEVINIRGLAVGMIEETMYSTFETQLNHGDKLLLVSDGITETINMQGKMLKVEGLANLFSNAGKQKINIQQALDYIIKEQQNYTQGRIIKDDVTLIGVEIN
ncbi:MAG: serine/threonine-protein phosphatase [Deltaproteobacteria bacterium]|jgi:serine phosphatase RsbU (regulator of sigma subunit)|nr:serine/threonine-protein phosphatase [Deltaproteobacteria bacterium]